MTKLLILSMIFGCQLAMAAPGSDTGLVPLGTEKTLANDNTLDQLSPHLVPLSQGGFLLTWNSLVRETGTYEIRARRFDKLANPVAEEFVIEGQVDRVNNPPQAVQIADDKIAVTWVIRSAGNGMNGVFAQVINLAGEPLTGRLQVNTTTQGVQNHQSVAALADGSFVVSWASVNENGNIYAQRLDAEGNMLGAEERVNSTVEGMQFETDVTALKDGGYVIAWTSIEQNASHNRVRAQRYDAQGLAVGEELLVDESSKTLSFKPRLAGLENGGFVVVWTQSAIPEGRSFLHTDTDIFGRQFDAKGKPVGKAFAVHPQNAKSQQLPFVSSLKDGGFFVVWKSDSDVYAQRFTATGQPKGNHFAVPTASKQNQTNPVNTGLNGNNSAVIVWNSNHAGGRANYAGVFGQVYLLNAETKE